MGEINRGLAAGVMMIVGLAGPGMAVDYSDHADICAQAKANVATWSGGGQEAFDITCPCEVAAFEEQLDADEFKMYVDWKIDAKAFAKNLPKGVDPMAFMGKMMSVGLPIQQACKS